MTIHESSSAVDPHYCRNLPGTKLQVAESKKTRDWLAQILLVQTILIFATAYEPVRILHRAFVYYGAQRGSREAERPAICDFLSARFSVITSVLQYVTSLLFGHGSRLILILQGQTWSAFKKQSGLQTRRALMLVLCWISRRHDVFRSEPFCVGKCADSRLERTERQNVVTSLFGKPECKSEPYFVRVLRHMLVDNPFRIFSVLWQTFLIAWLRRILLSIVSIELMHAGNKRRGHRQMSWAHFVVLHTHAETMVLKRMHQRHVDCLLDLTTAQHGEASASSALVGQSCSSASSDSISSGEGYMRAQSPLQLFRARHSSRTSSWK